jgi:hypothetical protein
MNTLKLEMKIDDLIPPAPPVKEGEEAPKQPKASELVSNVIKNIIISYSQEKRGLNGEERKQYYSLCSTLDKAVAEDAKTVELEDTDAGFLKKCKRECKMMPGDGLQRVEELIDGMTHHK